MKYLFIAEKPSLMRDVQACYRNHRQEVTEKIGEIDFTALSGHVCTNYMPTDYEEWKDKSWKAIVYPMIPDPWQIKPIADPRKQATIAEIGRRVPQYDGIIVGTDSDVEGYGIYWLLEQYLSLNEKPALRFIEHSLTDAEVAADDDRLSSESDARTLRAVVSHPLPRGLAVRHERLPDADQQARQSHQGRPRKVSDDQTGLRQFHGHRKLR